MENDPSTSADVLDDIVRIAEEGRIAAYKSWQAWTQDPTSREGWEFVTEAFPRVFVYNGGGVCPFQVEGLVGELGFYLRERSEHATLTLFDKSGDYINSSRHLYHASYPYDISGSRDNFLHLFELMYERIEKIVPLWTLRTEEKDRESHTYARAWTPEEAVKNAQDDIDKTANKSEADWTAYFMQYYRTEIPDDKVREQAKSMTEYTRHRDVQIVGEPELNSHSVTDAPDFEEFRIDLRS